MEKSAQVLLLIETQVVVHLAVQVDRGKWNACHGAINVHKSAGESAIFPLSK